MCLYVYMEPINTVAEAVALINTSKTHSISTELYNTRLIYGLITLAYLGFYHGKRYRDPDPPYPPLTIVILPVAIFACITVHSLCTTKNNKAQLKL